MILDIHSGSSPEQLSSAPWTEATSMCNVLNPPAGGQTANIKMRAVFLISYDLNDRTYYKELSSSG